MASRRDELRAHQFLKQRAVSALVVQETDPEHPPFRRPTLAAYWGVALALLALGATGVLGLFSADKKVTLRAGRTVIVESGTGARFVFLGGRLHPVTNYTSALLVLGQHLPTQTVRPDDLLGVPRGPAVGIDGAPDTLPDRSDLLGGPWSVCSQSVPDASGAPVDRTTVLVGAAAGGGRGSADSAVLVRVAMTGREYLVWHGYRHELSDPKVVSAGLGLAGEPVLSVAPAWIDTVPAGPAVAPVHVPGAGRPSRALPSRPGTRAGQVLVVQISGQVQQFFLALTDRVVPLTGFQEAIQLAAPSTAQAYRAADPQAIALDPAAVSVASLAGRADAASGLPAARPDFVDADATAAVCARFVPGHAAPDVSVGATVPGGVATPSVGAQPDAAPLADRAVVAPGRAALVTVVADEAAPAGTLALVTDDGTLYPLAGPDVVAILGYQGVRPVRVAATVAARLPQGPSLDPLAAREPH